MLLKFFEYLFIRTLICIIGMLPIESCAQFAKGLAWFLTNVLKFRRKVIVEPSFGTIKEGMSFRKFTLHGLEGAKTQWAMVCFAFNLRKLYRLWSAGGFALPA